MVSLKINYESNNEISLYNFSAPPTLYIKCYTPTQLDTTLNTFKKGRFINSNDQQRSQLDHG